jgi:hypothetical protein
LENGFGFLDGDSANATEIESIVDSTGSIPTFENDAVDANGALTTPNRIDSSKHNGSAFFKHATILNSYFIL